MGECLLGRVRQAGRAHHIHLPLVQTTELPVLLLSVIYDSSKKASGPGEFSRELFVQLQNTLYATCMCMWAMGNECEL